MLKKKLLLSLLSVVAVFALTNKLAVAQARPESDPRFEKLAKEFYPKALWRSDSIGFTGRFYSTAGIDLEPKPLQKPTPPMWIGS